MSIWSDAATIVSATLSGDINFKVVQAYRSAGAWFVFAPLTLIGALVFYYRERWAERLEERMGRSMTSITHPIIAALLGLGLAAAFLPPVSSFPQHNHRGLAGPYRSVCPHPLASIGTHA